MVDIGEKRGGPRARAMGVYVAPAFWYNLVVPEEKKMITHATALVMHPKDNVATALIALKAGSIVLLEAQDRAPTVTLVSDVPRGHKFALVDLGEEEPIIKYGECIGRSTRKISKGEHVHVQNVTSGPGGKV